MAQLWGHHTQRQALLDLSPGQPVALTGPSGIGKHLLAATAAHHHAAVVDVVTYRPTKMADVRELTAWLRTGAIGGSAKAAALDLDGSAPAVVQALLKLLEEPPPATFVLLSASGALPATLTSRVRRIACQPLSDADVAAVLGSVGVFGDDLGRLVALAGGRPGHALRYREAVANRAKVLQLLHAIQRKDWVLVTRVLSTKWDAASVGALQLWLADVLGGTTKAYAPGEKLGLATLVPRERLEAAQRVLALQVPPSLAIALAARRILA